MKKNQNKKKRKKRRSICWWVVDSAIVRLWRSGKLTCSNCKYNNCRHIAAVEEMAEPEKDMDGFSWGATMSEVYSAFADSAALATPDYIMGVAVNAGKGAANRKPQKPMELPELTGRRALTIED